MKRAFQEDLSGHRSVILVVNQRMWDDSPGEGTIKISHFDQGDGILTLEDANTLIALLSEAVKLANESLTGHRIGS